MKARKLSFIFVTTSLLIWGGLKWFQNMNVVSPSGADNISLSGAQVGALNDSPYSAFEADEPSSNSFGSPKISLHKGTHHSGHQKTENKKKKTAKKAKGKKQAKKAKDKDKKTKVKKNKLKVRVASERPDKSSKPEAQDGAQPAAAGGAPAPAAVTSNENTGIPTTYDEWAQLLLGEPNAAETDKFIEYFKLGLVTNEIFYGILQAMVNDDRLEMASLGLDAAGRTPSNLSFLFLADTWNGLASGSEVRAKADAEIRKYVQVNYLSSLELVVKSAVAGEHSIDRALDQIRMTADRNLQPTQVTSSSGRGDRPGVGGRSGGRNIAETSVSSGVKDRFSTVVQTLEIFLTGQHDQELVTTAQQTLDFIRQLIES